MGNLGDENVAESASNPHPKEMPMRRDAQRFGLNQANSLIDSVDAVQTVAPDQYCDLAVSNRPLIRFDDAANGLKGLRDVETGESYVVDVAQLMSYELTRA
jgi:hypothetical protein